VVTDQKAGTWIFTSRQYSVETKEKLEQLGLKVFVTSGSNRVDLHDTLTILGEHAVSSVLIEGGGEVNASFLTEQLVDKFVLYVAPKLIGGKQSPSFFGGSGIEKMADAIDLAQMDIQKIGKDFKFTGYPVYKV
jgi:diaminohydroxyphosphoribosylaminopyrimidine deaminase/5-amino-6-(5-phosphoribosylamino)uracil reductase